MNRIIICLSLLIGTVCSLNAQDKLVLRNGRTIDVKVQRSIENRVEYTYPGETSVYERPKTAISYILYQDGRREIFDGSLRETERSTPSRTSASQGSRTTTSRTTQSSARNDVLSGDDEIFWEDVKTTFNEADVKGLTRLKRVSAVSNATYKDAIQQLKKKAAEMGGTTVLVMDIPESDSGEQIEIMGIAYREEGMRYSPRSTSERNNAPAVSPSNERRRRIAQQMDSYHSGSDLEYSDNTSRNTRTSSSPSSSSSSRNNTRAAAIEEYEEEAPDAIYLMNGRVVRGTVEEFEPDDFVSIRSTNGRIYEYSMDDVKRVSRGSAKGRSSSSAKKAPAKKQAKPAKSAKSSRYDDEYDDDYYNGPGYKGTFDVGYNLAFGGESGIIEFSTSHGYQINENLFVGLGAGLQMYSARDPLLKSNMGKSEYPQYASPTTSAKVPEGTLYPHSYSRAIDSSFMMLPIFADIRGYLPMPSPITPFASLKVGYTFNLSDSFGAAGIYMAPSVGAKYNITPKIGLTFSVGYTFQGLGESGRVTAEGGATTIKGGYGYYTYKDENKKLFKTTTAQGIHIKLGVEF